MIEWLDEFYGDPDLKATMLRNFLPLFSSYVAEATGGPVAANFVQALAESYVDRHLGSSRAQLQEVVKGAADPLADLQRRFDEWEEKRPGKVAANELVRSANAAQVEQFREAGVTKMVWRASGGKTCPFCAELDGTVIEVTGTFFEAGDELNPEGATAPIHFESSLGHPPVHQGCVCSVEAVTTTELAPVEHIQQVLPNAELDIAGIDDALTPQIASAMDRMALDFPEFAAKVERIEMATFRGKSRTAFAEVATSTGPVSEVTSTIRLNKKDWVNPSAMTADLIEAERSGWAPPGASTPESVLVHEFAHIVDVGGRYSYDPDLIAANALSQPISEYASGDFTEAFAENFRAIYYTPREQWTTAVRVTFDKVFNK